MIQPDSIKLHDLQIDMEAALNTLSRREKGILLLRLDGRTYDWIGIVYNVTRERIRQIVVKALKKLAFRPILLAYRPEDWKYHGVGDLDNSKYWIKPSV